MIGRPIVRDVKPAPFATLGDHIRAKAAKKPRKAKRMKPLVEAFAGRAAGGGFVIVLPIVLVSEANMREHPGARSSRAKAQREAVKLALAAYLGDCTKLVARGPIDITITRLSTHPLDDDNLAGSCKRLRDGIAEAFGVNDRRREVIAYFTAQERSPKWGARLWIRRRAVAEPPR